MAKTKKFIAGAMAVALSTALLAAVMAVPADAAYCEWRYVWDIWGWRYVWWCY